MCRSPAWLTVTGIPLVPFEMIPEAVNPRRISFDQKKSLGRFRSSHIPLAAPLATLLGLVLPDPAPLPMPMPMPTPVPVPDPYPYPDPDPEPVLLLPVSVPVPLPVPLPVPVPVPVPIPVPVPPSATPSPLCLHSATSVELPCNRASLSLAFVSLSSLFGPVASPAVPFLLCPCP